MALSEIQRTQVTNPLTAFCEARVPAAVRSKIRVGFRIKGGDRTGSAGRSASYRSAAPNSGWGLGV